MTPNEIDLRKAARSWVLDKWTDGYSFTDIIGAIQEAVDFTVETAQDLHDGDSWDLIPAPADAAEGAE